MKKIILCLTLTFEPVQVVLLKSLWDMITMVRTSIDDWKTTKWANINVEQMELDCKKFAKDIRALDKEVSVRDCYSLGFKSGSGKAFLLRANFILNFVWRARRAHITNLILINSLNFSQKP